MLEVVLQFIVLSGVLSGVDALHLMVINKIAGQHILGALPSLRHP
jgi:hypothetical protein